MTPTIRFHHRCFGAALCVLISSLSALGEVTSITGSSTATVIQFDGILPVQSDVQQVIVPFTKAEPPALSAAQIDRVNENDELTASGAALALFEEPNLAAGGAPNDVGLDLAAFGTDDSTSWYLYGEATETRAIVVRTAEAGGGSLILGGASTRGSSRVVLSGAMFITSQDSKRDLTGAEIKLKILVERRQFTQRPANLIEGEIVLSGGPDGTVTVSRATGNFGSAFLPVVDFTSAVPEVPLVQALLFSGLELPYEYDFEVDKPFELELVVSVEARTIPGGVGASAIFGLPQVNLPEVMQKVAKDDRGEHLASAISGRVDTTGAAYQNRGIGLLIPGLCGASGVELLATGFLLALLGSGNRRRARRRVRLRL